MRILHLIDSAGLYGAERMLVTLCVEQRRLGHDVRVVSARLPEQPEKAVDIELRNSEVPVLSWPMRVGSSFRAMREICEWAVNHRVDVLHSHGYKFNVLLATARCPVHIRKVTTVHGYTWAGTFDRMMVYKTADRLSHFAFDQVVHVSEVLRRHSLVNAAKRSIIPNGIDVASLPMVGARPPRAAANAGIRLLAVGRLALEKDYELLLYAVALLRKRGLTVSCDIFGEGPEEARLRRIIAREGLDGVELRGYSDKIPSEILAHDILVVSSRTEGMPITLIEGMCLGTKIVATRVGGIPSMLEAYPLATLADRRRAADLADAIQTQIGSSRSLDPGELHRLRCSFSSATMARRYVRVYSSLLGTSSCESGPSE
jgi:glycosyltransferase involved in cell wall biosynthesis